MTQMKPPPGNPGRFNSPFTNRAHNAIERKAGTEILKRLIKMLRPKRLIALGNDAEKVLGQISGTVPVLKVRHPSYGGQAEFTRQIREIYGIKQATLL